MEYNFSEIEKKWQQYWEQKKIYKTPDKSSKPKYYVLDMFPYPSGDGLHVGHPLGYIASDIYARFKRLTGYNVLHPMGFDAFGLPAEQYAIETGQHPNTTTQQNIATYQNQLLKMGLSYDWSRKISTCSSDYYQWTQWIFLQMYDHWYDMDSQKALPIEHLIRFFKRSGTEMLNAACNENTPTFTSYEWRQMTPEQQQNILMDYRLMYQKNAPVNWCPYLGTVLANDEVRDGLSVRGGHPVEKKDMKQWFMRITAYADRLLDGLEQLQWSDSIKEMQRNWIGRSEGANVYFELAQHPNERLEVFTTRPDTIFGVTFMVLAPEHPLVNRITTPEQKAEIDAYIQYVAARTDIERQAEKKVTGAFTGAYAINPLNNTQIPIYISEYVLISYGTGAIMAVPADDDRDYVFAQKFNLPIIEIIDKSHYKGATKKDKLGKMINSNFINGMEVPDAIRAVCSRLEELQVGKPKINYRLRDAGFSRQRYWGEPIPIVYKNGVAYPLSETDLPVELPEVTSYRPTGTGKSPLAAAAHWVNTPNGQRETDTMPGYAGSSWYYIRYMDNDNPRHLASKRCITYWRNVDFYMGGSEHATGHLLYSRFWHKFLYDTGVVPTSEPFQRLINQGMIQGRSNLVYRLKSDPNVFVSAGLKDQYEVTPINIHINLVKTNDLLDISAFRAWREEYKNAEFLLEENGTYICGWQVEKMSKSKYNVVNPDDVIAEYGADCFRLFEMFLGPIEDAKPWNTDGISGVSRFLRRFWSLYPFAHWNTVVLSDEPPTKRELKVLHYTIKKVTADIENLSFNTCVSTFMECVNELIDIKCQKRAILEPLLIVLAPFAPYITEHLWHALGNNSSIHTQDFPVHNEEYLVENVKIYPIQINGKVRTQMEFALNIDENSVKAAVLNDPIVNKWLNGQKVAKFLYIPGKIISISL